MDNESKETATRVKMSGYINLKIKKKMRSYWKNYWFVLEDRLLLYYRSKDEYEAISPCKGSINLGPPCTVKSLSSVHNAFQLETRTITYTLKTETVEDQKKWMQTILSALNQNQNFNNQRSKRLSHFRYSLDDLIPEVEPIPQNVQLERQNTMPHRIKTVESNEIIQRLQRIGAHSYGGSLGAITKIATRKTASPTSKSQHEVKFQDDEIARENSSDGIYEKISRDSQDSNVIYERITGDLHDTNRTSFLVDNENYSVPVRRSDRETKSLIVENEQYGLSRHVHSEEVIYSEPKLDDRIDFNKNNVIVENSFYACADIIKKSDEENLYEDLDQYNKNNPPSKNVLPEVNPEKKPLKKSKSLIRRVWKRKKKIKKEDSEDEIYAEIDPVVVEKTSVTDGSAIQMLSELQNILEKQKSKIKIPSSDSKEVHPEASSKSIEAATESEYPILPPKTHKISQEQVRSLDQILEDLESEQIETKTNVQKLIEKFEPDEVILRKPKDLEVSNRHSDDLNELLNELLKVTTAPIMTPGVTTSLGNSNLTDEEWLKILPVRQRRLSEPDYDVPRIHKSISSTENQEIDAIPATRFFGPVLPPNLTHNSFVTDMTPDSLEVELPKIENLYSYTSHNYNLKSDSQDSNQIIYALPKSYVSVATHVVHNTCRNFCGAPFNDDSTIIYKSVKNVNVQDEIFKDSLEYCDEFKTEF